MEKSNVIKIIVAYNLDLRTKDNFVAIQGIAVKDSTSFDRQTPSKCFVAFPSPSALHTCERTFFSYRQLKKHAVILYLPFVILPFITLPPSSSSTCTFRCTLFCISVLSFSDFCSLFLPRITDFCKKGQRVFWWENEKKKKETRLRVAKRWTRQCQWAGFADRSLVSPRYVHERTNHIPHSPLFLTVHQECRGRWCLFKPWISVNCDCARALFAATDLETAIYVFFLLDILYLYHTLGATTRTLCKPFSKSLDIASHFRDVFIAIEEQETCGLTWFFSRKSIAKLCGRWLENAGSSAATKAGASNKVPRKKGTKEKKQRNMYTQGHLHIHETTITRAYTYTVKM